MITSSPAAERPDARDEFRAGAVAMLPLLVGLIPFALVLGALAAQKGITPLAMALMSVLVFAGGSQFVAVELWHDPAPWLLLAGMALMVNCRHLLMGTALVRPFAGEPASRVYPALHFMADEVWAMALQRDRTIPLTLPYYAGLAAVLWLNWVFWTVLGCLVGSFIDDPVRYGFDFAFVAVFVVLLRGMWRGPATFWPWLASGAASAIAYVVVPGPWYVAIGAAAGLAVAAFLFDPEGSAGVVP